MRQNFRPDRSHWNFDNPWVKTKPGASQSASDVVRTSRLHARAPAPKNNQAQRLHYRLTRNTKLFDGKRLFQIQAMMDLPQHQVRRGDLGGYIASEKNLQGRAWIENGAFVYENAIVTDSARIGARARVKGTRRVDGTTVLLGPCIYE